MMYRLGIVCLLFSGFLQLVSPKAFLSVKFLSFRNPRGFDINGHCCDGEALSCSSPCDHRFTVCLDQIDGPPNDIDNCTYGRRVSSEIPDRNYINFDDKIGDLVNPIVWPLTFWPGQVRMKIDIVDVDDLQHSDKVAFLQKVISAHPVNSQYGSQFKLENQVQLILEAQIYCGENYYNEDCSVYCKPRDDSRGHFLCDRGNGTKICLTGWTGKNCQVNKDDCAGIICQNGGSCRNLLNSFRCECKQGFEGRFCDHDFNECLSQDNCLHGNCINTPGSFTCTCFTGYMGRNCGTDINECLNSSCHNGALCIDQVGDFHCICPAGFTGKICDTDVDECQFGPCKNDGECKNIAGAYSCHCMTGYHGNDCSLDVDECQGDPCINNGMCDNHVGGYTCNCVTGFEGKNCEININECLTGICKNGQSCKDLNGSFECTCSKNWQGKTCEQDVNECLLNPCRNNGTCQNFEGEFLCVCQAGFTGHLCEEDINECEMLKECEITGMCNTSLGNFSENFNGSKSSDFCNSGTCYNSVGGFYCKCPVNWTGQRCEVDLDECEIVPSICRNNATCQNKVGTFVCECKQGWTGTLCDDDVNECLQDPEICKIGYNYSVQDSFRNSHFVCLNKYPDFMCICEEGWAGSLCDEVFDECQDNPWICSLEKNVTERNITDQNDTESGMTAKSHKICMNDSTGYSCACAEGWTGQGCGIKINNVTTYEINSDSFEFATTNKGTSNHLNDNRSIQEFVTSPETFLDNMTVNATSGPFSYDVDFTTDFSGLANQSGLSLPFFLDCQVTPDIKREIDRSLKQSFIDTGLFMQKEVTVSHTSESWEFGHGTMMTSIMPVIKLNGEILSDPEVSLVVSQVLPNITNNFGCNIFLENMSGNFSFSTFLFKSSPQRWHPGFVAACILTVLIVVALSLVRYYSKIKIKKKAKFKIQPSKVSRSFRNEIYHTKIGDLHQKKKETSPSLNSDRQPTTSIIVMIDLNEVIETGDMYSMSAKNEKSSTESLVHMADGLSFMLTGRENSESGYKMELNDKDGNNASVLVNDSYDVIDHNSTLNTQSSTKCANITRTNNQDGDMYHKAACKHNQISSGNDNIISFPQAECEMCKTLPYIDDPTYSEIILKEDPEN